MINEVNCAKFRKERSNYRTPRTSWFSNGLDTTAHTKSIVITLFGITQALRKPACPGASLPEVTVCNNFLGNISMAKEK